MSLILAGCRDICRIEKWGKYETWISYHDASAWLGLLYNDVMMYVSSF